MTLNFETPVFTSQECWDYMYALTCLVLPSAEIIHVLGSMLSVNQYWGLNPGLCACQASNLSIELHPQLLLMSREQGRGQDFECPMN